MKRALLIGFLLSLPTAYAGDGGETVSLNDEPPPTFKELIEAESTAGMPMDLLRYDDALRIRGGYAQGSDLIEDFIRIIFPTTGRERRTMFLPIPYWGKKKPSYTEFQWKRFESAHFDFYTYSAGEAVLQQLVQYLEEEHERNNRIFGVENRFIKKIPIIYYQTRRDFEQTHIVEGPIPESLGGLTELFAWRRVTFPFEGEKQKFAHVSKHEGTHVYQIAKSARKLPLWFIEGSAETNSIKWDAEAEMTIRDAFVNGFYFHLDDLWQIQGSWLMYKQGNFTANLIWDEYGEEGFRKIYDNAASKDFEENLKQSLGMTPEELDNKVFSALGKRYGDLLTRKDLIDESKVVDKKRVLLDSHGPFFLSGGASGPRNAIYVNHYTPGRKLVRKKVVSDRRMHNESLGYFSKGASIDDRNIVYVIKRSARDVLRVVPYSFDEERRKFKLGDEAEYGFSDLPLLSDPVFVGESKIAFIGYAAGFSNIYRYDRVSGRLEPLTTGQMHYSGLDYSPVRNELVFSREEDRTSERVHFDRNLYLLNLDGRVMKPITETQEIREEEPRFSPDGKFILFVADPDTTFDLFQMDLSSGEKWRLTKMKVGALHPAFGQGNSLLFNGFKRMSPTIYAAPLPTAEKRLALELPSGPSHVVSFHDGFARLEPQPSPTPPPSATPLPDGLQFLEGKGVIGYEQYPFTVQSVAKLEGQLLFNTERGMPGSKKVELDDRQHFFVMGSKESGALESLDSTMVARKRFPDTLNTLIGDRLSGRPIIRVWVGADGKEALVLVNNRLATDYEKFQDKPDVGVVIYHFDTKELEEIESGPLEDLSDQLQWVVFLTDEKILLAIGEEPFRDLVLQLYDGRKKKYEEIDFGVGHFRVSPDKSRFAWLRGHTIYFRPATEDRETTVRGLGSWDPGNVAFDFLHDNSLLIFTVGGEDWIQHQYGGGKEVPSRLALNHGKRERVVTAAIDRETGDIALRVRPAGKSGIPEKLLLYPFGKADPVDLSGSGIQYGRVAFRGGYLTFSEVPAGPEKEEDWAWKKGVRSRFDPLQKGELLSDRSFLLESERELFLYRPDPKSVETIAGPTAGYAIKNQKIFYSSLTGDRFQLFEYDRPTRKSQLLSREKRDEIDPRVFGKNLVWAGQDEKGWILKEAPIAKPGKAEAHVLDGFDVIHPEVKDDQIRAQAFPKPSLKTYQPEIWEPGLTPSILEGQPARTKFKLQSLTAAAAFDGRDFRFFVSGFADNLFSDVGLFVNAAFLSSDRFASVSYVDLVKQMSYSFRYNSSEEIQDYGFEAAKFFILDRYRSVTLFSQFEIQEYGRQRIDTLKFVTPEMENRAFYIIKGGAVYSYDVTIWDQHGPVSGSRFFFRTETGLDTGSLGLASIDANLDFRVYNEILPRFGFAHRIVGGTSQGDLMNVFLLGGNVSFRGFGFDDLEGQNYWVASEDLRVPIFDILGAKFFDPLDQVFGFFTRYFDIRGGIYGDVGAAWYNEDKMDIDYSVGYFVNVPTIFGLVFRFSQGFLGGDSINIWFGVNW
ncbi:MAG TPA: hypothetical protein VI895_02025 [Bdellovibrionota bacterium]|nr:hypothetical protein [Bdellovibrionota bacterium]